MRHGRTTIPGSSNAAFSNTGDFVICIRASAGQRNAGRAITVRRDPDSWVAQRRFSTLPLATPLGEMFPCIGVYTVDGKAAGLYGRLSRGPVVDFTAIDTAALIEDESTP